MMAKIWNKRNNEVVAAIEWTNGRLNSRRYSIIVSHLFFLASDSYEYDNLIVTFDNTPQTIEAETKHDCISYSTINMNLYVNGVYVKTMNICN